MVLVRSLPGSAAVSAAIALAYALTWLAVPSEGHWIYDTALKKIQVRAIVEKGSLALAWPGRELDPALRFRPIAPGFYLQQGEELYSAYSPVFPLLSAPFVMGFGERGHGVLPLLGALIAGLGVARLTRRVVDDAERLAPLALTIALLATPLYFYSYAFWEHTLAAGFGCFVVDACLVFRERLDLTNALRLGVLVALPIYLRPEQYLFASVVLAFAAWTARARPRLVGALALATVAALLPLWGFHFALFAHPLGPHIASQPWSEVGFAQYVAERGAVASRLLCNFHGTTAISIAVGLPIYALLVAKLMGRFGSRYGLVAAGLGLLTAGVVAHGFATAAKPMHWLIAANGLFAGSPLLVVAFASDRGAEGDPQARARRVVLAIVVVYAAIYAAFIPEVNSRGIHWGNRFLLVVYPLLAVLCAASIGEAWRTSIGRPAFRSAAVALVVATVALQLYSVVMLCERKAFVASLTERVLESETSVVASDTWFVPVDLAGAWFEKQLFFVPEKRRDAFRAQLAAAGVEKVLYVDRARAGNGSEDISDGWLGFERFRLHEETIVSTSRRMR